MTSSSIPCDISLSTLGAEDYSLSSLGAVERVRVCAQKAKEMYSCPRIPQWSVKSDGFTSGSRTVDNNNREDNTV